MMFDIMRIIFMVVSIVGGNFAGVYLAGVIGTWGALVGALIVGVIIYLFYSLLSGQPINMVGAILFGILNYVSTMITGMFGSSFGMSGGIFSIAFQAVILSLLWGWIGGKAQPTVKSGLKL